MDGTLSFYSLYLTLLHLYLAAPSPTSFTGSSFLSSALGESPGPVFRNVCLWFCGSVVLSVTNFQASDWSKVGVHSVSNFLDCTLYSVQSVVRALTTRELYSLRSTCVLTLNTNSAHNTLRNKIGMSVGIAVVGI